MWQGAGVPSVGHTPPGTPTLSGRPSLEGAGNSGTLTLRMSGPRLNMALPPRAGAPGLHPPASPLPVREDDDEGQDAHLPGTPPSVQKSA